MADTIVKLFLENAEKNPKAPALQDIRGTYSYEEMNRRSACLAEKILSLTGGKRIALLLPRIKDFIVAVFAVLRAGGAVVPIDGEYPVERVHSILADVNCALCLTTRARAADVGTVPALLLEDVFPEGEDIPEADLTLDLSDPKAEGYIFYTSGSTGKPKGVVHRQEMLTMPLTTMREVVPMGQKGCKALHIAGFSFVAGLMDISPMMGSGGCLYIASETERKNTDVLFALFKKRNITGMFMPPKLYDVMRQLYGPLPLQYVLLAGEKSSLESGDPGVWEGYGSSEAMTPVLLHRAGEGGPNSLGKPCPGIAAYLLDEDGRRIEEPDVIGELCISSDWVANGYNNMPKETAERFTDNPFDPGKRMYHTGDYMALDRNGNYIFHGRRDRMVKVRGYRVELGEIDQVMARKEGIAESASVDVEVNGGAHIACYYTPEEQSPAELKAHAGRYLPDYMIPDYFVPLKALPRNDRGKIDFPRLKKMEIKTAEAEYEPPKTETERKVCAAFAATLGLDRAGAAADFFELGGTSLSAAVLISLLSEDGLTLSFQDVSAHPTPRALAAFLDSRQEAVIPAMDRDIYPLTKTQMGIYLESLTGGSKATYTLPYLARAAEGVTAEALISAVGKVLEAHPGMKYIIRTDAHGMPGMVPVPDARMEIPVVDGTEEGRLDFMREFMPVVPMLDGLLIHPAVYRTPERCYLALKTHLIFFDATSISQFIAEMNRALAGQPLEGERFTVQQAGLYEERLMTDGSHDRAREYHLGLFRDMEEIPALAGDLNGPLTPGVSKNTRYEPGTLTAERVKAFCEKIHISENTFFQGAMGLMLGKYLNSRQVSFSTVYNGRPLSEMSHTIGTLIKRIPVYADLRQDLGVEDYLRGVSRQIFSTMANDIYSFDEVLKTCPVNEDVEFIYQGDLFTDRMGSEGSGAPVGHPPKAEATRASQPKQAEAPLQGGSAPIEAAESEGSGAHPSSLLSGDKWFMEHYHTGMVTGCLSIQFFSTNGLYNMTIEYRNEKFTEKWAQRFAQDLFKTAEGLLQSERIGEVCLMTDADRALQASFNSTKVSIPFVPVHEQIARHARKNPDKPAVIAGGKTLSFRELDLLSSRLAKAIAEKGIGNDDLVGVLFDRTVWAYVAEIAVLKAGCGFMPFIPDYPDDRIQFCMKDSASRLLITCRAQAEGRQLLRDNRYEMLTLEEVFGKELNQIIADGAWSDFAPVPVYRDSLAYCIYTSGSTGKPKGVMIEHRNIANYVHRNEKSIEIMHYAEPGRVCLAIASFSFDVSVVEEFVPLCNGNTVVIATEAEIHDPALLARLIRETGATGITCTPTYLMSLLEIPESREAIRQITFFDIGAEAFPRPLYDRLRELRKDSVILNVYGPTECTMGCAAALMGDQEQVTVGRPIANTTFYVADTFGNPLPVGLKGELIICGDQVGRGYVNPTGKNTSAFFTYHRERAYHSGDLAAWTDSGEIRIFGRMDNQIKLRGFRIELDEIEKVMMEFPGLSSGAVAVRKAGGTEYLAGYYTAGGEIPEEALRAHMQEKLPEYMVPSILMRLEEMPMTVNGKVNRKALPEPDLQALKAEYIPPETETEKTLCAAFAHTLKLEEDRVGLLDDFFDLGGDSLKAMVVLSEAQLDGLTAADVFQLRTPGAIARELTKRSSLESLPERDAKARLVSHTLSPLQNQMIDNQLFRPDSTMWSNTHFLVRFGAEVDADRLCAAVNASLRNHPALSVAFYFDEANELRQKYTHGLLKEVRVQDIRPETEDSLADILLLPFTRILNACLCKVNVFRGRKGCYLFMDVHHLLMDGGSLGVVLADIINAYFGRELKPDYYFAMLADAESRAAEGSVERDRAWFRNRYGDDDWCNIPEPDHESGNINQAGRMKRLTFTAEEVAKAEAYWGVTHSVMAICAGLMALSRFTGRKHVMINWIFNNRLAPEAENAAGMLIRNLPAALRMEEVSSTREALQSVKEQVAEGIAHASWDFMAESMQPYLNDCMEVNLQLGINGDELDELPHEQIDLHDEFSAAGARLEMELLENEFGDNGFDSDMEYAEGLFDRERIETFHDLYIQILEDIVACGGDTW